MVRNPGDDYPTDGNGRQPTVADQTPTDTSKGDLPVNRRGPIQLAVLASTTRTEGQKESGGRTKQGSGSDGPRLLLRQPRRVRQDMRTRTMTTPPTCNVLQPLSGKMRCQPLALERGVEERHPLPAQDWDQQLQNIVKLARMGAVVTQ